MKRVVQFFFIIFLSRSICAIIWEIQSPFVKSLSGGIRGFYNTSEDGRKYAAFQSVPYAESPVGELRFEPPIPVKPWNQDIQATSLPPSCAQYETELKIQTGVEDCLHLNVYVPNTKKNKLPVIFWIHGGGFQYGTSSNFGPKYLMDRDVILVTINYRVGMLGFLSTGDDVVPGNMGLKDQSLALKWVSRNIKYFGGDPKKITLMGVSAGGASVHYHYLSPLSRGLFRNGVSFSGTTLATWSFDRDGTEIAKSFAEKLNCPVNDSSLMVQCLKGISADGITKVVAEESAKYYFPIAPFPPVIEKAANNCFINDTPINILKKGKAYDVPWITGVVENEGLFMTSGFILNETLMEYTDTNWEKIGPILLVLKYDFPAEQQPIIANNAREHYFGDLHKPFSTSLSSTTNLTNLVGEGIFLIGCIEAAKLQAKVNKSPVRYYHYTYRASQSASDTWSKSTINFGVSHYDDVSMVLENRYINPTKTEEDKAMLQDMLNYWYSIANDESPNLGTPWPPVDPDSEDLQYMHIVGPKNFTVESNNDFTEIKFWNQNGLHLDMNTLLRGRSFSYMKVETDKYESYQFTPNLWCFNIDPICV